MNPGVGRDKCKNAKISEVKWGDTTDVAQIKEMLNHRLQGKVNWDCLLMDLIILEYSLAEGKKKKGNVRGLRLHSLRFTESWASKVVADGICSNSSENTLTGEPDYSWGEFITVPEWQKNNNSLSRPLCEALDEKLICAL